ncbi:transposase, IS4 family protein [Bacillus methanolicus PB1]|uniref:Transposase, IS4 family protein n=1 Tax=Bacillus methanolicus PB1 TaxID=997296 RepID=I3E513_BACMT|nr:IS4 family transposase [Bacillus methanolicus]EIJ80174.1 transposase, IS4 family protein [Bacillus methanolicus PB1]EIJ80688.1 transposase, IS4 family protein [Bacillus methanolicus PB1]EIJ80705.1 transposase, IS4 family protein [Bacillus methanolicus PB1]EIJ81580.1 transposase, IS4 family protein [Bacillus methanolicus PB1]EIJ81584.1 transposase, IS4 family protein [Bacillus methanolicus PB1]
MSNVNIAQPSVVRQCFSLLSTEKLSCPLLNYDQKKLRADALVKIFVAAQLGNWSSYTDIEEKLRADKDLMKSLNLESISGSQLSRRINELPTEWVQDLFFRVVKDIEIQTRNLSGLPKGIGRLAIIDSSSFKLPEQLANWAYVSKNSTQVKMHTRLVVASPDIAFPDQIIPSTGNVSDFEGSDFLVVESDSTYVMDRGYASHKKINNWAERGISFIVRIKEQHKVIYLDRKILNHPLIRMDATVKIGVTSNEKLHPVRLVEFFDEEGHLYRIITTRFDLPPEQIMEIYRHRWAIEIFFRWIKQHLRSTKIWSTKPQGIWNQMFLSLIAYGLVLQIKLKTQTKKTIWGVLRLIRTYLHLSWQEFEKELNRRCTRTSKGRQKVPKKKEEDLVFAEKVAMIKPKKEK